MDTYQRLGISVVIIFSVLYVGEILFFPVNIDSSFIPTLVNGVTTSISIIVGLGGAVTGFVFRKDIDSRDFRGRRAYYYALGLFLFPLVYPWGSYLFLALGIAGLDVFALKYSFGGYLLAMMALLE